MTPKEMSPKNPDVEEVERIPINNLNVNEIQNTMKIILRFR